MSDQKVRVRFAPSPTGGLHLGGVRTALFNYLFAKHHNGTFVLRIEDTDQNRYVEGAEQYIIDCLNWCDIPPDESPAVGGHYGPYRQSERKSLYREYAERLVAQGNAYYAFDTPAELGQKRRDIPNFQYGQAHRNAMCNSIALTEHEVDALLDAGTPHVIRIKVPQDENISFNDMIRGDVAFDTSLVDDKVLLKADGMPTYHLAVVVDDYLMKITHAFRGEEWLPSAPVHLLLWKYLGWADSMPKWAHLPLILKPDGHGKLSKRDGARLGFPVYAMSWADPATGEVTEGFKEKGFMPQAFVNMLALLGWNDGTDQEIFTMGELIQKFSVDRISKSGARFDYEKALWFNTVWTREASFEKLLPEIKSVLAESGIDTELFSDDYIARVLALIKDRLNAVTSFYQQAGYFFKMPREYDLAAVQPKWTDAKTGFFKDLEAVYQVADFGDAAGLEQQFKALAEAKGIKAGELMLPFRVMLVGGKFGPHVFDIAALLDKNETVKRIETALAVFAG